MKAIVTKYHGATNHRPSRVSARAEGLPALTLSWDHAHGPYENHAIVAKAFADKYGWSGKWAGGGLPDGNMVFVWIADDSESRGFAVADASNALRFVRLDCGYTLRTWDTGRTDSRGQTRIGYELCDWSGHAIFKGEDFAGSPMHADDSDETLRSLLAFLTLRPGDTDAEYFANYTEEQMAFTKRDAERLSWFALEDGGSKFTEVR